MTHDNQLYRAMDVWKRATEEIIICYRCFELISAYEEERGFCVQSADHYFRTDNDEKVQMFQSQFLELLLEQKPNKRSKVYKTLEEAITAFRRDFRDW